MKIDSEEFELKGKWVFEDNQMVEDEISRRIDSLINGYLVKISISSSGWESFYQDPNDSRYWELIYEQGELQGGGPPTLKNISLEEAHLRYNFDSKNE